MFTNCCWFGFKKLVLGAEAGALNITGGEPSANVEIPTKILCLTEVPLSSSFSLSNLLMNFVWPNS